MIDVPSMSITRPFERLELPEVSSTLAASRKTSSKFGLPSAPEETTDTVLRRRDKLE